MIRWSVTASLAGFLFGFDTVVISGAEQTIQSEWQLDSLEHGLAMSMAIWGTVIGALLGSLPADHLGRTRTLQMVGLLYFVSAVWSGLAENVNEFMIARLIGGLGVGMSTVASPLYITEISPPRMRGRLTGLFQFNIVAGILVAYVSNRLLSDPDPSSWRWMLGIEAFPALIFTVLCFSLPESPRWLVSVRRDRTAAHEVLSNLMPRADPDEVDLELSSIAKSVEQTTSRPRFWSRKLARPIQLVVLLALFNQLSGINAVLYFAPRIFQLAELQDKAALLQSIGIGVTNLVFTLIGLRLIDRVGRKRLLILGSWGYIISLGLCSFAFSTKFYPIVPACIFGFIAAHAIGQGTVIWVFISEIFPNEFRARGQSLGSFTHWIGAALLTLYFPIVVDRFSADQIFLFFAVMMGIQFVWVKLCVPETHGRSLEQLQRTLGTR